MPVIISMLRGVNVGAHNRIKMDALRSLYASLKLEDPQTYVQSGNVIFRAKEKPTPQLARKIQAAIEKTFKIKPEIILRTADDFRAALAINPFAQRKDVEPGKLLITFLADAPSPEAQSKLDAFKSLPEELHLLGRELYIYFPNGAGKSKLPWAQVEKFLKVPGTARNLNSVMKMLEIADGMEAR